MTVCVLCDN